MLSKDRTGITDFSFASGSNVAGNGIAGKALSPGGSPSPPAALEEPPSPERSPCVRTHREGAPLRAFPEKGASRGQWSRQHLGGREKRYLGTPVLLPRLRNGFPDEGLRSRCPLLLNCLYHSASAPTRCPAPSSDLLQRKPEESTSGWDRPGAPTRALRVGPGSSRPEHPHRAEGAGRGLLGGLSPAPLLPGPPMRRPAVGGTTREPAAVPTWAAGGTHPPFHIIIPDIASFISFFPLCRIALLFVSLSRLLGTGSDPGPGWPRRRDRPAFHLRAPSAGEATASSGLDSREGTWEPPDPARHRGGGRRGGRVAFQGAHRVG